MLLQSRFDQVKSNTQFATSSNPMRGMGMQPSSPVDKGGPNAAMANPLLGKKPTSSSSSAKKKANKKAARMAASDFDNDDVL